MSAAQYAREALERAEKATPLVRSGLDFGWVEYTADGPFLAGPAVTTTRVDGADADFIEGAVRDVPKLARAVIAVVKLHRRAHAVFSWKTGLRYEEPCPTCDGKAGVHECGCWADSDMEYVCAECDERARGNRQGPVAWPCPTVRALSDALEVEA